MYRYRALERSGRIQRGEREALNLLQLESELAALGLTLLRAKPLKPRKTVTVRALKRREMIDFFYYLETLLRAGVPIVDSLRDLAASAGSQAMSILAGSAADAISNGETVSGALAFSRAVPEEITRLIAAGEQSGTLPTVLAEIVRSLKWRDELVAKTKKALLYPAFALVTITGVTVFLMSYVVPQLITFIKSMGEELPLHTRALIAFSEFVQQRWYVLLGGPVLLWLALTALARAHRPFRKFLHARLLALPAVGNLMLKLVLARAVDVLALMYRSGVPILDALGEVASTTGNLAVRDAVEAARARVSEGLTLSEAFGREALFPPLVLRMLRVGENTGALDEALSNVSYYYMRDIDDATDRLHAMIEPVLTVVLGLLLGWIMLSVLGPIYDIISKIKP